MSEWKENSGVLDQNAWAAVARWDARPIAKAFPLALYRVPRTWAKPTAAGRPDRSYTFLGVKNPPDLEAALAGERATLAEFRTGPFDVGEVLSAKRRERNPFGRSYDLAAACLGLARFFSPISVQ